MHTSAQLLAILCLQLFALGCTTSNAAGGGGYYAPATGATCSLPIGSYVATMSNRLFTADEYDGCAAIGLITPSKPWTNDVKLPYSASGIAVTGAETPSCPPPTWNPAQCSYTELCKSDLGTMGFTSEFILTLTSTAIGRASGSLVSIRTINASDGVHLARCAWVDDVAFVDSSLVAK